VVPAWEKVITETHAEIVERLEDRVRLLRALRLHNEANEAQLCANLVRNMKKQVETK
jgi:hypothetical protein